ncbi:hypothetical protein SXCC_00872 [Gluconacetobacter sp. SXCC-1]|nr:hypothetical protein SXCC_00872 [Gluconacetobacter sp. SXCC-1]
MLRAVARMRVDLMIMSTDFPEHLCYPERRGPDFIRSLLKPCYRLPCVHPSGQLVQIVAKRGQLVADIQHVGMKMRATIRHGVKGDSTEPAGHVPTAGGSNPLMLLSRQADMGVICFSGAGHCHHSP